MLPYWFSAMTVQAVGKAALRMVDEVRHQFRTIPGLMEGSARPNYERCISICTKSSLREMVPPGALVLLSPVVCGVLFGTRTLAGLLAGALVSGVQMAISAANTGGAWDNAKKYIEAGANDHARSIGGKGSESHKAAVVGDTVGDPLKDTSGPSLNILIKLMAVESLVFAPFFYQARRCCVHGYCAHPADLHAYVELTHAARSSRARASSFSGSAEERIRCARAGPPLRGCARVQHDTFVSSTASAA